MQSTNLPIPDTVFHGTSKDFDHFSTEHSQREDASYGIGVYLSPDRDVAGRYGPIVLEVQIQLRNPFRIQLDQTPGGRQQVDFVTTLKSLAKETDPRLRALSRFGGSYPHEVIEQIGPAFFTQILKNSGFDGIVIQTPRILEELVAFDGDSINILDRHASTFEVFASASTT